MISSSLRLLLLPHPPFLGHPQSLHSLSSFPQHFPHFLLDLAEFEIHCFERRLRAESRQGSSKELVELCSSSSSPPLLSALHPLLSALPPLLSARHLPLSSHLQLSLFPLSAS